MTGQLSTAQAGLMEAAGLVVPVQPSQAPVTVAEGPFEVLAAKIHRLGENFLGRWVRWQATHAEVVCQECGPISADDGRDVWPTLWPRVADTAMEHAETTGHQVACGAWKGVIYGPQKKDSDND